MCYLSLWKRNVHVVNLLNLSTKLPDDAFIVCFLHKLKCVNLSGIFISEFEILIWIFLKFIQSSCLKRECLYVSSMLCKTVMSHTDCNFFIIAPRQCKIILKNKYIEKLYYYKVFTRSKETSFYPLTEKITEPWQTSTKTKATKQKIEFSQKSACSRDFPQLYRQL